MSDTTESLYGDSENRIRLIQDYLYALFTLYPEENFSIHTAVNIILLLFQRSLAVAIFKCGDDKKCEKAYYSISDPQLKGEFQKRVLALANHANKEHFVPVPTTAYMVGLFELHWGDDSSPSENSSVPAFSFHHVANEGPESPYGLLERLFKRMGSDQDAKKIYGGLKDHLDAHFQTENGRIGEMDIDDVERKNGDNVPGISVSQTCSISDFSEKLIDKYVKRIRKDIIERKVYRSIKHSPLITHLHPEDPGQKSEKTPFPNILFILRTGTQNIRYGHFNYTLRILLPKSQRFQIEEHMKGIKKKQDLWFSKKIHEKNICDKYSEGHCTIPSMESCIYQDISEIRNENWNAISCILQSPTGSNARMASDSCFCSGILDFISERIALGEGRFQVKDKDHREKNRFRIISCLFHQLNNNPKAFLYPIAVSGRPWITTAVVMPDDNEGEVSSCSWMKTLHFSRSILRSEVVGKLRSSAKDLYLELVAEEFQRIHKEHFKNWEYQDIEKMTEKLNIIFEHLSCVFPFRKLEISAELIPSGLKQKTIGLIGGKMLFFRLKKNINYDFVVDNRTFLKSSLVADRIEMVVKAELKRLDDEETFEASVIEKVTIPHSNVQH